MTQHPTLIAHSDENVRDIIKKTLANNIPLIVLESVPDTLDIVKRNLKIPRLLFLEINSETPMPIIEEIRHALPSAHIILMAHPHDETFALEGIRHGANGYILSPFKPQEILHLSR